jgi:hypothetical protein
MQIFFGVNFPDIFINNVKKIQKHKNNTWGRKIMKITNPHLINGDWSPRLLKADVSPHLLLSAD